MSKRPGARISLVLALVLVTGVLGAVASASASTPTIAGTNRYMVVVKNAADYNAVRADAASKGLSVVADNRQIRMMVVVGSQSARDSLAGDARVQGIALDHVEKIADAADGAAKITLPSSLTRSSATHVKVNVPASSGTTSVTPDPAFNLKGLMWNEKLLGAPDYWDTELGSDTVTVGVADTGLDYTHVDLASKVSSVVDFTANENPNLCRYFFGASDAQFARRYGGPANGDWNGHGSWIGGNIAGALNGTGMNGIAPGVSLVSLKISGWCGSAFDSTILGAFTYAADNGIDVVSISFGGYLDRSDPNQDLIYDRYVDAVAYAKDHGTVIVAAAGNEHTQIGDGGVVLTHALLAVPGDPTSYTDVFGQYETPGGIPGVVDVSSTGNVVMAASASCTPGTMGEVDGNATCKPTSDAHQPFGVGKKNQLTYYSNFGPRIDVAGPGGAREFNLPRADRGGTPGWPYTDADGFRDFEDFSITSNFALEIPCFLITGTGFDDTQCYTAIQGTSMATPHASAVLALILSAHPELVGDVDGMIAKLKATAAPGPKNYTPALSATDTSPADLTDLYTGDCTTGYCHLGGPAIPSSQAYGAGIVNAARAVAP